MPYFCKDIDICFEDIDSDTKRSIILGEARMKSTTKGTLLSTYNHIPRVWKRLEAPPSKYVKNEEMLNTRSILKIIFPFLS